MSLFSKTKIEEYSNHVSQLLSNYKLYNRSTFHKWFFGFTEDDADNIMDEQYDDYKKVMTNLINGANPCTTDSNVHIGYTAKSMRSAFGMRTKDTGDSNEDEDDADDNDEDEDADANDDDEDVRPKKNNYDILFAIDTQSVIRSDDTSALILEDKFNAIVGVIIIEMGQCMANPKSWCVNVICVKPNTVKGSILMGACLYCIKANPSINQECLLELVDGYKNLSAFYSYTGLGFLRDDSLWDERCFHTVYCMPMRTDLLKISQRDIINKVLGAGPKFILNSDADTSGLWNRKCHVLPNKDNEVLKEIQTINNLMLRLTLWENIDRPGYSDEKALYNRYRIRYPSVSNSNLVPILKDRLNVKLKEFDRLTVVGSSWCDVNVELNEDDRVIGTTQKCSGVGCNILGGKRRNKTRAKKSRCKKTRGKKTRGKKTRGKKTRCKKLSGKKTNRKYYKNK
jgi:hypothetical protein